MDVYQADSRSLKASWPILCGVIWLAVLAAIAVHGYLKPHTHTVFAIYAGAARSWWAGEDMYVRGQEYYRYSPTFAIAMSPLAFLPAGWGNALWKLLGCLSYAAGLAAWARRVVPARLDSRGVAALLLLALPVSLNSMYIGQANLLMLGSILLGVATAADGKWNRSAVWLTVATLIKGYPLALALLLAAIYPRRFPLRFLAALALGLALPFAAQAPEIVLAQYASWVAHLRDSTFIMRERLRSLDHVFQLVGYPMSPRVFAVMGMAAGAAVLLLCLAEARRTGSPRQRLTWMFQLFAAWVLLFGPATEACTYVVAAPALAWALIDAFERRASLATRVVLMVSVLLMEPIRTDLFGATIRNFANEHGSQPIGALFFVGYLATEMVRRTRTARRQGEVGRSVMSPAA